MQTLVGTDPVADERLSSKERVYEAGARPELPPSWFTPDRVAAGLTALVVFACTAFVIWQLHPMALLFTNTMDAGGDNAGHIAAPYYLIHQLLPHGQVTGWDPDWFDGFPLYTFYFPLPALLVAVFQLVMPYAVAFKLVTVSGTILMPGAAYLFGRLSGFRRPVPALMCAAMLPFLWNTSYQIDGGNIASTMAGEFSFSLSMTFGLVFLGLVVNGLRTGRYRALAAVMFACCILCHVVPGIFFAFAAIVFTAATWDWRRLEFLLPTGITGALLAGFWLIPFGVYVSSYTSSMGYTRVPDIGAELFPLGYLWVEIVAVIGCLLAVAFLDRRALALGVLVAGAAAAFWFLPSGQVYNARWLPFWFLTAALMAGYGFGELTIRVSSLLEFERWHATVGSLLGTVATVVVVGIPIGVFQFAGSGPPTSFVPGWIQWNYTGFQNKAGWNVYEGIVNMLGTQAKAYGCGRLKYEYTGSQLTDQFGSTMAFMSLPMWTNNCIDTTEGLYFESATTTPYHFLDEAQVSTTPSNPMVGIPYGGYNLPDGVTHLQEMGVRYLLAGSTTTQQYAAKDPSLVLLASTPGVPTDGISASGKPSVVQSSWKLYLIKDSTLVAPLSYEPVVETMSRTPWLNESIAWYQHEQYWSVPLVRGGPASWPHDAAGTLVPPSKAIPIQPTTVSNIQMGNESISFDVSQIGVPVLVKIPYFPNWQASGADGPWESTPNLMVVVPTSHHVTLTYGTSKVDVVGYGASILGVGLVVTFSVIPPVKYERRRRRGSQGGEDDATEPEAEHDPFAIADLGSDTAADQPWLGGADLEPPTGLVPVVPDDGVAAPATGASPPTDFVPVVDAPAGDMTGDRPPAFEPPAFEPPAFEPPAFEPPDYSAPSPYRPASTEHEPGPRAVEAADPEETT